MTPVDQNTPTPGATLPNCCIKRRASPGLRVTCIDWQGRRELHLTLESLPAETPTGMVDRLAAALRETGASIVRHEIFGPVVARAVMDEALQQKLGKIDWPVTYVAIAAPTCNGSVSGMHVFAIVGTRVDTIRLSGMPVGRVFSDGHTRHCLLGDLSPPNLGSSKPVQARETLETLELVLHKASMNMTNVVRTWLFLQDIYSWYPLFNAVRTEFYRQRNIFKGLMPASTGVGCRNSAESALVAGAWAIQSSEHTVSVLDVPSPLQCPSLEYGSAFSRAVLISEPGLQRLLISGTASITPNGCTAYPGSIEKQIKQTMQVVQEILGSRHFDFSHVTRATAYFKNSQDAPLFEQWRLEHKLGFLPLMIAQADICREELLFEIELDAMSGTEHVNRFVSH